MKTHLMFRDADFDPHRPEPENADAMLIDLGGDTVLDTMAGGDPFLRQVARAGLLASLADPVAVGFRQAVLADCLAQPDTVRQLYDLAVATLQEKKTSFWSLFHGTPGSLLSNGTGFLGIFEQRLRQLRAIADAHAPRFRSDGFVTFFAAIDAELDDAYLDEFAAHVRALQFGRGLRFSARLGRGNKAGQFVARTPPHRRGLRDLFLGADSGPSYTVTVPERDEAGSQELAGLRDQALNPVANAVAQAADHLTSFFTQLRTELGFYLSAVNLHQALTGVGVSVCVPQACAAQVGALSARGLYDPALPLRGARTVVGNDLDADGQPLVVITGANQGGKSTFLRAIAIGELLAAAGLPVPADSFTFTPTRGIFTHYRRPEDATMVHGKFEEELGRMRQIVERAGRGGLVAMNESFASTNEREGADVAVPVITALLDAGLRVVVVTHSFELADRLHQQDGHCSVFLRAHRRDDGARTFQLTAAPPLTTSFGADLYRQIFTG